MAVVQHMKTRKLHLVKMRDRRMTRCGINLESSYNFEVRPQTAWLISPSPRCGNCERAI